MNRFKFYSTLTAMFLLGACQQQSDQPEQTAEQSAVVTPEEVKVGKLNVEALNQEIYCTGVIDVPPMERKVMHSYLAAQVTFINVIQGEEVKKGQVIAKLSHPDLIRLQQELLRAKADMDFQQTELDRKNQLLDNRATSIRELNEIKVKRDLAEIAYTSSKEHLSLLGIEADQVLANGPVKEVTLTAPFDAKISKLWITNGQYVTENQPLVELLNKNHKHLELDIFSKHADRVKIGQKISFNVPGSSIEYSGEVYLINPDIVNNRLRIHGHLDDESINIKVGTFIEAKIVITDDAVAQIAIEELIQEGEHFYLHRPVGSGFERVEVQKGRSNERFAELVGIDTTSNWVIAGNYYLQEF